MTHLTLTDIIRKAFTTTESPTQVDSVPHDPEQYEILGDVPVPVQHLHNHCCQLIDRHNDMVLRYGEMAAGDEKKNLGDQINTLRMGHDALNPLRWALLAEAFPHVQSDFDGLAILEGWKVAGQIRQQTSDAEKSLGDMFNDMFGGRTATIMMVGVPGRSKRN